MICIKRNQFILHFFTFSPISEIQAFYQLSVTTSKLSTPSEMSEASQMLPMVLKSDISYTLTEENTIRTLLYTWAHRSTWLVSVALTDRESQSSRSWWNFALLNFQPHMAVTSLGFKPAISWWFNFSGLPFRGIVPSGSTAEPNPMPVSPQSLCLLKQLSKVHGLKPFFSLV